ncbi:MAG: hypothetical protein LBK41_08930 [Clostridiales bacterium]|jgi:hypothetical protein|nr:hypothetical protein [Clostridiales bacterium]
MIAVGGIEMARVKATADRLNSWDDVDRIFRLICEAERNFAWFTQNSTAIEEQQTEMRRAINDAKEHADKLIKDFRVVQAKIIAASGRYRRFGKTSQGVR